MLLRHLVGQYEVASAATELQITLEGLMVLHRCIQGCVIFSALYFRGLKSICDHIDVPDLSLVHLHLALVFHVLFVMLAQNTALEAVKLVASNVWIDELAGATVVLSQFWEDRASDFGVSEADGDFFVV